MDTVTISTLQTRKMKPREFILLPQVLTLAFTLGRAGSKV